MADNNKAVGPLAAAKLVSLIKAETAKKYDKTGGKIDGSAEITGSLKVGMSSEFSSSIKAGSEISSDMLLTAPIVALHDTATEESISFGVSGENAAKVTSPVSGGGVQYARLAVGTPTGDNDAATKAYVDGRTHDYYDVTVTSSADAAQTIDGGIISVRGSADKTVSEIAAAYAAGAIVRCIYNGNIMQLVRAADGSYSFSGVGANYGVARSGNITITIMSTSNGDVTWITSAAGELPIPDSDVSQNGCVLVVGNGQWMYSADKFIPATPTSNGLMSAADKTKLDSIDSVCYDIYAKIGAAYTHDSVYKYGCTVSHTFSEINAAVHAGKTPRVLLVDNIENPSDTRIICPLLEYDTSRSEGGYYFDAPGLVGVSGSGRIYIDENGAMYTCSAGELPAVDANQDGKYLMIDGGMWTYRRPDVATTAEPGFMSAKDKDKLDGIETGANKTVVDEALDDNSTNPVQNKVVKAALDGKASTAVASQTSNGLMSAKDKAKLDVIEDGATRVIVDDAMSDTSTNPVQSKVVKAALDGKLSTQGGEISGHLRVGLTVSAEGSVSVGRTSADTGIHFEKAASDAGRISHGSDPMTGVSPIARLKVATPTEDDDAATKAYVDNNAAGSGAVRYDAAQTLEAAQQFQARKNINAAGVVMPQFQGFLTLAPANAPLGTGVGLSPSGSGNNFALDISDVNEGTPTLLTGVKTPTDADTNAAATVEYVKNKVSEVSSSGGVDVDNALSATSTNPVQNKVITSALAGKADKTALNSKADKTALDAKADKTALDSKMDKSGGTFTGNVYGKYFCGTWLQSTAASDLGRAPGKIAVLDDSGWVYYRTPAELLADIGAMSGGDYYTKAETDAAIAVRASTSAYGTTKLSNSTTSSSKTLAATPYAVKTALAQAKAYVDSAIAVAINSAY